MEFISKIYKFDNNFLRCYSGFLTRRHNMDPLNFLGVDIPYIGDNTYVLHLNKALAIEIYVDETEKFISYELSIATIFPDLDCYASGSMAEITNAANKFFDELDKNVLEYSMSRAQFKLMATKKNEDKDVLSEYSYDVGDAFD